MQNALPFIATQLNIFGNNDYSLVFRVALEARSDIQSHDLMGILG